MSPCILLAESNPGVLIVGRNVLRRAGFRVVTAGTLAEGLKRAVASRPDLLILDGLFATAASLSEFAARLKRSPPILLTVPAGRGSMLRKEIEGGRFPEAADIRVVLETPLSSDALLEAVQGVFDGGILDVVSMRAGPETLDAEVDCELLSVEKLPVSRSKSKAFQRARPAQRLAQRVARSLKDAGQAEPDPRVLVRACREALEHENIFASLRRSPGAFAVLAGKLGAIEPERVLAICDGMPRGTMVLFEQGDRQIELFADGPHIIFGRHRNLSAGFTIGRFLVDTGAVDQQVLDAFLEGGGRTRPDRLGHALIARGFIDAKDLRLALIRQTEELVYEAIRWDQGSFSLFTDQPLPNEAKTAGIALPVPQLVADGALRLERWLRISRDVGGPHAVPHRIHRKDSASAFSRLSPGQQALLSQVDGERSVDQLVDQVSRPVFDVYQALAELRSQRLVTVEATARSS